MPFGIGFHPAFMWPLPGAEGKAHESAAGQWGGAGAGAGGEAGWSAGGIGVTVPRRGVAGGSCELFKADAMLFPDGAGAGLRYGVEGGPEVGVHLGKFAEPGAVEQAGGGVLCAWSRGMGRRRRSARAMR